MSSSKNKVTNLAIATYAKKKSMKHNILNMMAMTKEKGKAVDILNTDVNIVDALKSQKDFGKMIPTDIAEFAEIEVLIEMSLLRIMLIINLFFLLNQLIKMKQRNMQKNNVSKKQVKG